VYRSTPRSQTPTYLGRTNLSGTDVLRYAWIFCLTRETPSPRPPD
jgi:hypothetical protein